jgi:hypothetical protein
MRAARDGHTSIADTLLTRRDILINLVDKVIIIKIIL